MIMDTNKAKASYGVGMSIAESLSQQDLTALDLDQVMAGMHAIFSGIEPLMSPEEANIEIQQFLNAQKALKYEANKQAGAAFLSENGQRPEVQTTASGLQYEVLHEGEGATAHLILDFHTQHREAGNPGNPAKYAQDNYREDGHDKVWNKGEQDKEEPCGCKGCAK